MLPFPPLPRPFLVAPLLFRALTPLETTSTPSEAPAPGEISAPDGAVATAVANKPASQRFWETKPRPPEAVTGEDYLGPDEVAMPVDDSLPPDQVRAPQ